MALLRQVAGSVPVTVCYKVVHNKRTASAAYSNHVRTGFSPALPCCSTSHQLLQRLKWLTSAFEGGRATVMRHHYCDVSSLTVFVWGWCNIKLFCAPSPSHAGKWDRIMKVGGTAAAHFGQFNGFTALMNHRNSNKDAFINMWASWKILGGTQLAQSLRKGWIPQCRNTLFKAKNLHSNISYRIHLQ